MAFTDAAFAQAAATTLVATGAADGPRAAVARAEVADAGSALGQVVTSVYGEDAGGRFAGAWGAQAAAFDAYARAEQLGDAAAVRGALVRLGQARSALTTLLADVDPEAPRNALDRVVARHAEATTASIRAAAVDSPKLGARLRDAATAARALGRALVLRAAEQFPAQVPGLSQLVGAARR